MRISKLIALFFGLLFFNLQAKGFPETTKIVSLGSEPAFIEISNDSSKAYVSVPDQNSVYVVALTDLSIADQLVFSQAPIGIDLNEAETELYVALSGSGEIAIVDLLADELTFSLIDVSSALSVPGGTEILTTYDVENIGSKLFVTAAPGFGEFSNLAVVDMNDMNSISRGGFDSQAADFVQLDKEPILKANLFGTKLWIYEQSGSDFHEIDPASSSVVKSVGTIGTGFRVGDIALNDDEVVLALGNGQILSTQDLSQMTNTRESAPQDYGFILSAGGTHIIGQSQTRLSIPRRTGGFDFQSEFLVAYAVGQFDERSSTNIEVEEECGFETFNALEKIRPLGNDEAWLLISEDGDLCFLREPDTDEDNIRDIFDNCPDHSNSDQLNSDSDALGDVCDLDDDNDGIPDLSDPFPLEIDGDSDGVIDPEDAFPTFSGAAVDTDGDGNPDSFFESCDAICIAGSGLVEDDDDDGDGIPDAIDPLRLIPAKSTPKIFPDNFTSLDFVSNPEFIEIDYERALLYATFPDDRKLLIVSLESLEKVAELNFLGNPTGLDLSDDGKLLYVGLSELGMIAKVDLENQLQVEQIDLFSDQQGGQELIVGDLIEVGGNMLLAITVVDGASNLRKLDLQSPSFKVTKVGQYLTNGAIERFQRQALLGKSHNGSFVFVQERNGFFKLDSNTPFLSILSDGYTDPSGFPRAQYTNVGKEFYVTNDGDFIFTDFGQIIRASNLEPVLGLSAESFPSFRARLSLDNQEFYFAQFDPSIGILDTNGRYITGSIGNTCLTEFDTFNQPDVNFIVEAEDKKGWYVQLSVYTEDAFKLCYIERKPGFFDGFPAANQLFDPVEYFPLEANRPLPYSDDGSEEITFIANVAPNSISINGRLTRLLSNDLGGREFYSVTPDGVLLHRGGDSESFLDYLPPFPISTAAGPLRSVTTYDGQILFDGDTLDLEGTSLLSDFEILTLPSGEQVEAFKFVQSQVLLNNGSFLARVVSEIWLAKGIGIVKVIQNANSFNPNDISVAELITAADFDGDGIVDLLDLDKDGDGVPDSRDAFPLDPFESVDTDNDGIGNNADEDDDNDQINDFDVTGEPLDNCPLDFNPQQEDTDLDGIGDACEGSEICFPIKIKSGGVAVICL